VPAYWPGGVRHEDGASPVCSFCAEREKAGADMAVFTDGGPARGSASNSWNWRRWVPRLHLLADRFVVVMKRL